MSSGVFSMIAFITEEIEPDGNPGLMKELGKGLIEDSLRSHGIFVI